MDYHIVKGRDGSMEWLDRLNLAVEEIEAQLMEEVDYDRLAQIACCSSYHFQRMFSYLAGVSLAEYIRRRRMSLAAEDILSGQERIVEIALKYGYQSPTAFNRAFQRVHGIPPSAVRQKGIPVKSFPKLKFQMTIKGVEEMNYRIEQKEGFSIAGISIPLSREMEKNFDAVPKLWGQAMENGTIPKLISLMDRPETGILGVSFCSGEEWSYWIAAMASQQETEFPKAWIPARTWAVFSGEGSCPQAIQQLEQRIFADWLPSSGYEYDEGPDVERYLTPDPNEAVFEVWMPIRRP